MFFVSNAIASLSTLYQISYYINLYCEIKWSAFLCYHCHHAIVLIYLFIISLYSQKIICSLTHSLNRLFALLLAPSLPPSLTHSIFFIYQKLHLKTPGILLNFYFSLAYSWRQDIKFCNCDPVNHIWIGIFHPLMIGPDYHATCKYIFNNVYVMERWMIEGGKLFQFTHIKSN